MHMIIYVFDNYIHIYIYICDMCVCMCVLFNVHPVHPDQYQRHLVLRRLDTVHNHLLILTSESQPIREGSQPHMPHMPHLGLDAINLLDGVTSKGKAGKAGKARKLGR